MHSRPPTSQTIARNKRLLHAAGCIIASSQNAPLYKQSLSPSKPYTEKASGGDSTINRHKNKKRLQFIVYPRYSCRYCRCIAEQGVPA